MSGQKRPKIKITLIDRKGEKGCHRVVGADGSLTGYAGGIDRNSREPFEIFKEKA